MRRRITTILCSALCLLLLFSGCAPARTEEEETGFHLYCVNEEQNQLIATGYTPQAQETQALVEEIIAQQQVLPGEAKLPLLPVDTTILGYTMENNGLTLDMDASYATLPRGREILCRGGLVREFLQISGVDRVRFTIEGKPLTDSYGNEVGYMTNDSFVENSASTINAYQSVTMTLYFTDSTGARLLPESRKVYYNSSEPLEWAVVEEIEKGPRQSGHFATFSSERSILSVITQDNVCYVNMSKSGPTSTTLNVAEEVQIYSIVNSLIDTCGIEKVQFSVDGDSNVVFRDRVGLTDQFTKNESLIDS